MTRSSSQLLKRLPFLLLVAVGLIVWKTGYLPKDRTLVWNLPPDASIRSFEVQVSQGDKLLEREQFFYPQGPADRVEEHVKLGRGDYVARFFLQREGKPEASSSVEFRVGNEDVIERNVRE